MSNQPLLLNIGYHKTGTTWLQRYLFNNQSIGYTSPISNQLLFQKLIFPHPLRFNAKEARIPLVGMLLKYHNSGLTPVISLEDLSGNPYSGGYNSMTLADRLVDVFPEARVLIVIREQKAMILSTYKQYIKGGGTCSLKDFIFPPHNGMYTVPLFDLERFEYHYLLSYYISLFGRSNVLILPYELFRVKPYDFIREIIHFCDIKEQHGMVEMLPSATRANKSLSGFSSALRRQFNKFTGDNTRLNPGVLFPSTGASALIKRALYYLDTIIPNTIKTSSNTRLEKMISELVGNRYQQSNDMTAKLLYHDLSEYGYDMRGKLV